MRRAAGVLAGVLLLGTACTEPDPPEPAPSPASSGMAWRQLAAAPSERTEVAAAVSGTSVYVIGGFRAGGGTVRTVEVLDTATGRWSAGPDLPVAVNHAMAATVGSTVYVFGGHLAGGGQSAAAFRLDGGAWQRVADLPEGRGAGTAVALDTTVYVAGGVSAGQVAEQMLVYDTQADRWSTAPGPPTPREHLGGAGFDGLVYTVGGRTRAGNLAAFEVYDPPAGQWRKLPDLPTARGGLAAAATCSGQVAAVGGEELGSGGETFPEVEAFDVRAGAWRSLPPLPTPRHGLGVVAQDTVLYTLAGGPRPGLHVSGAAEALDVAPLGGCVPS